MSLQIAANHLASKGRGPDSQLIHMAPTEVAGLQALAKAHGGSLTINPETGLPEAGFLSNILPMVIGAGLSVASGGTLTPMMAGLMTGAGYGLIKGDLKAGLMAGLGAYGGAGMMGSVLGAGAGAAQEAAMANVGAAAPGIEGTTAAMQGGFGAGTAAAPAAQTVGNVAQATQYGLGPATMGPSAIAQAPMAQAANAAQAAQAAAPVTQMPTQAALNQAAADATNKYMQSGFMDQMKGGIGALAQDPSKLMTGANLKYGLAAAAPAMMATPETEPYKGDSEQAKYTYSPGRVETPEAGQYASSERTWFQPRYTRMMADGGPVGAMSARNEGLMLLANGGQQFADGGPVGAVDPIFSTTTKQPDLQQYTYDPMKKQYAKVVLPAQTAQAAVAQQLDQGGGGIGSVAGQGYGGFGPSATSYGGYADAMAAAGQNSGVAVESMGTDNGFGGSSADNSGASDGSDGGYWAGGGAIPAAKGRFLRGPGDGVSDSIPATIGGNQPARLADGEFVIPARIVSELGNGSSEAGARKLYAMMDRVQKARGKTVGKNKVATDSKAEKMLPA
jgi:hypothetical protein